MKLYMYRCPICRKKARMPEGRHLCPCVKGIDLFPMIAIDAPSVVLPQPSAEDLARTAKIRDRLNEHFGKP